MVLRTIVLCLLIVCIAAVGCDESNNTDGENEQPAGEQQLQPGHTAGDTEDVDYRWMPDDDAQKFAEIERQFAGFSATMEEVGYRYTELYWAGDDRNWDYADYQLEKLKAAIERGIDRRPARADSARDFLDDDAPPLREAIDEEDDELFDERIDEFTASCNTCHAREAVPFIRVQPPEHRLSPVRFEAGQ